MAVQPTYDLEFYGEIRSRNDGGSRNAAVEADLNDKIKQLEAKVTESSAVILAKTETCARLNEKIAAMESEMGVLRQLASGADFDQKQHAQAILNRDQTIRTLEKQLAEANDRLDMLNRDSKLATAEKERIFSDTYRETSKLEMQLKQLSEERDEELSKRETRIRSLEEELVSLRSQVEILSVKRVASKTRETTTRYVMAAPKVERLYKAAVEVKYEQDPHILAENQKLAGELQIALVRDFETEQRANGLI